MTTATKKFASHSLFGIMTLALIARAMAQPPLSFAPEPPNITLGSPQLPDKTVQDKVLLLLKAIEGDRYADFAAAITDDFKAALPPETFKSMKQSLARRLQKGYDLSYMGDLKKLGYTTYVWKIVFRDQKFDANGTNEVMVTITIKDAHEPGPNPNKVGGFYLD
ncbi:hypothetical protein IAD21_00490 [Abditibacteriota bacterium]|nr:hypothetical protein IAD21_00490 [Abditibacteriota bacterium]